MVYTHTHTHTHQHTHTRIHIHAYATHTHTYTNTHTHIKCNNKLYQLNQIKHLLNQSSLKIITSAYIISKLDYCNSLLTDIPKIQEKKT